MLNVFLGEQPDNIALLFDFFCEPQGLVIDISGGTGHLSSKLKERYKVVTSDIVGDPANIQADWNNLPFTPNCADAVLYDPPYLQQQSKNLHGRPNTRWQSRHSIDSGINHLKPIQEAFNTLKPGGILVTKIQNCRIKGKYVNNDRVIREACEEVGFILRDVCIYLRLAVGVFRNKRTPQQAFGFYIVVEKPEE